MGHERRRRRKLRTRSGETKFKIKFYGELQGHLITGTDFAPSIVLAVNSSTQEAIVLFDGCKHGFNPIFCESYSEEQVTNRPTNNFYVDRRGNDTFEIIISAYYQIDYDDEDDDGVDENGLVELADGSKIEYEIAKRNGFDVLQIFAINNSGEKIEILSEELA